MSRELYVVHEHDLIELVKKIMEWKHIHHVPVVDTNNKMIGMIDYMAFSKLDFRLSKNKELVAKQVMNQNFVCIHPDTELEKMHVLMSENSISSLAVIHDDELVGIVTSTDLSNAKTTS